MRARALALFVALLVGLAGAARGEVYDVAGEHEQLGSAGLAARRTLD